MNTNQIIYLVSVFFTMFFGDIILRVANAFDISSDYYFGRNEKDGLRMRTGLLAGPEVCESAALKLWCHVQCKGDYRCLNKDCYCLQSPVGSNGQSSIITQANSLELAPHFEDYDEDEKHTALYPEVNTKVALRHQIAHFCPNLSIARECISKCIEEGKPAFCAKDHRCYCGHRDIHTLGAGKQLDAYKQFEDMYKKYLGS